jgi:hypothetical protein
VSSSSVIARQPPLRRRRQEQQQQQRRRHQQQLRVPCGAARYGVDEFVGVVAVRSCGTVWNCCLVVVWAPPTNDSPVGGGDRLTDSCVQEHCFVRSDRDTTTPIRYCVDEGITGACISRLGLNNQRFTLCVLTIVLQRTFTGMISLQTFQSLWHTINLY